MSHHTVIMLLAGIGIPILAALNAALGQRLGSPTAAAVILFAVAMLASLAFWAIRGSGGFTNVPDAPKHLFAGGLFVAFYVLSVTFIAPKIGVGNAVFFVLIGQLISSAAIDHFGLFGARISPLETKRALGIAVMALGVWITQRA
ncbi:DMT family transporter [Tropicibacter alexandrii]|uniref:DMT family transporter n=1 Tax=Tropicibacter alexandrii TaxID=2267683 RepID=UPI000EF4AF01|nr:DMT family transporter [Tropicibacter alexandrii]